MLTSFQHKEQGLTLVELLIALTVSVVIVATFISAFFLVIKSSRSSIELGRLTSQLNHVVGVITHDIHRAGYWGSAITGSSNPFMVDGSTDIQINGSNNCILLTYDKNSDGVLAPIGANDERYGFRLMNNAIQYRPAGATFSCTAASANWTDLTDPTIVTITVFNVVLNTENIDIDGAGAGTALMSVRRVDVTITGQLVVDSAITKTIDKQIKVYNDKYIP